MTKKGTTQSGLQSEALKSALEKALAGDATGLEDLLARFGGLPSPRPHLALAAAFGEELASRDRGALALLTRLARDPSPANTPTAFLPVAAAHGFAARLAQGKDVEAAWDALFALAADERTPVRIGTIAALAQLAPRSPGGADLLIKRFAAWCDHDNREERWGALGVALEVIAERHTLETVDDLPALFEWLDRVLDDVAAAPRSSERSSSRRRVFIGLPPALATAVASKRPGAAWLEERCRGARHPDLRQALEETIERLRRRGGAEKVETLKALADALASSKKPPRDPTRSNEPARGRGRKARGRGA
jgi:hypothetical protein